nr:3-hydroxyacyl-ACP dehydratase FabZ [Lachnoclostridium sp. Marseille-P6806]
MEMEEATRPAQETGQTAGEEARRRPRPLTAAQLAGILPHRYPFVLVDRITDHEPGQWAEGIKCVSVNEPWCQGHFPGQPIMPGVLLIEALAQIGAAALLSMPENRGKIALFGGIRSARFRAQVTPGDVVALRCELTELRGRVGRGQAEARVNGKTAVRAELLFAIAEESAEESAENNA